MKLPALGLHTYEALQPYGIIMKFAIFLLIFAWIYEGVSSKALNRTSTTVAAVKNESASSTLSPVAPTQKRVWSTTTTISDISELKNNLKIDKDVVNHAPSSDSFFGRNSSIPVIALSSIVLVLVFVVIVLSVIIVINRKRLYRLNNQAPQATPLPTEIQQIPPTSNNQMICEDINQNPTIEPVTLGVFSLPDEGNTRNASLKYDQPYAHQKPLTDMIKNIMTKTKEPTSHTSRQSEFYLQPHELNSSTLTDSGNSANDELSSSNGCEYQVPRNAKKRAGLLTTDAEDSEYVVMMGEKSLTDDEKVESKSRKESKKASVKDTLRRIPENIAKSKIKFFQDRNKSHKELSKATDERSHYDVPKSVK